MACNSDKNLAGTKPVNWIPIPLDRPDPGYGHAQKCDGICFKKKFNIKGYISKALSAISLQNISFRNNLLT